MELWCIYFSAPKAPNQRPQTQLETQNWFAPRQKIQGTKSQKNQAPESPESSAKLIWIFTQQVLKDTPAIHHTMTQTRNTAISNPATLFAMNRIQKPRGTFAMYKGNEVLYNTVKVKGKKPISKHTICSLNTWITSTNSRVKPRWRKWCWINCGDCCVKR